MYRENLDYIVQELCESFNEFYKKDTEELEELIKKIRVFLTSVLSKDELKTTIDKTISESRKESIKNFRESFEKWKLFDDLHLSKLEKDYVAESLVDKINQERAEKLLKILTA